MNIMKIIAMVGIMNAVVMVGFGIYSGDLVFYFIAAFSGIGALSLIS